jgi:hypothetical protein
VQDPTEAPASGGQQQNKKPGKPRKLSGYADGCSPPGVPARSLDSIIPLDFKP